MTGRLNEAGQNPKLLADLLLGFTMDETPFASSALILPTKSGLLGGTSTSATRHCLRQCDGSSAAIPPLFHPLYVGVRFLARLEGELGSPERVVLSMILGSNLRRYRSAQALTKR